MVQVSTTVAAGFLPACSKKRARSMAGPRAFPGWCEAREPPAPGSRTGSPQQPEVAKSTKARDGFALIKQSERDQPDVVAASQRAGVPWTGLSLR